MGEPRVLLLHGLLSTGIVWRPVVERLARARAIVVDLPGYGRNRPSPRPYTLRKVVESLRPVVSIERPEFVVGHSMGAIVALALAAALPQLRGVGLLSLPVYRSRAEARRFVGGRGFVYRFFLLDDVLAHAVACRLGRCTLPLWAGRVLAQYPAYTREVLAAASDHDLAAHQGALREILFKGHALRLAGEVRQPVFAMHGSQDGAAPVGRARRLAQEHGWRWQELQGAAHELPLERPDTVAAWIDELTRAD